ncbi:MULTISPECIES: anthranilate phosphoribosyltransferase [Streptomyces]|uniref:Anthranilate phosphoribosyltransferase n=1 Tax=Streptomyces tsukubensis (strain DSM 42081 / NBRC 108919 / NRRL 18488 / 9993) TaxID=1114943 RepID=I2MX38_STRT9|nr:MULTISPECIES: anthranilate phosphoribosyltransferase [Streptomyces]AZK93710.1 anthranilate phosphoribosyltransferase [Streptomyces tsukubensis]EIF89335.1 anthranilate phosphoribosyltransferase [Streptomyces tsukubensis NRRL18488]MYS63654.1 anthranilate phosphoribosyltransferase [Streptomyces sp. SID5473]QKM70149.1 anthranilate phosphoribosyltransferase [Streptomyces tsukubensis NRRL18488]TAI45871.1 anthranilate phosphoribosyltransferase [Streptomyces tsukubensis]
MNVVTPAGGDSVAAHSWPAVLDSLLTNHDQSADATAWAMDRILSGEATDAQIAGFAVALRAKGETVAEISGLVRTMYEHAHLIDVPGPTVDIVGTGGDGAKTVNISTMASIVVAGTGAKVVKHGNRAASSASGASDVLEKLGVNLELTPRRVAEVAEEAGITFCFAVKFHPALRYVAAARRELGIRTTFNFLGPLTNPARVGAQATGVADARMAPIMAGVLAERGSSALVFRGDDGLDELTTTATSRVWIVRDGTVREEAFDPRDVGIDLVPVEALRGADAAYNAEVATRVLAGERGPVRDAVVLNAAAALVALAPTDEPLTTQIAAAAARAADSLDSGAASATLTRWIQATK